MRSIVSFILSVSVFTSMLNTGFASEESRRYPLTITNTSNKNIGVDVNGVLFLLKPKNPNCPGSQNTNFSDHVNLGMSGPTKIKVTYGSFKSLSRQGYNPFPPLPKNAFIAIESALLVTTAFGAAGYSYPIMQDMLKKTAQRFTHLGNSKTQSAALESLWKCTDSAMQDPYIVGTLSAGQNITQGNIFGVMWNVITFNNAVQRDAFIKAVTEQAAENNEMTKEAQKKLADILKKESVTKGWWKKVTTVDATKIKEWQDEFGHTLSMEDLDNLIKSKLKDAPGEAAQTATKFGKSGLEAIKETSTYYAGQAARYAVENPQMACLYVAGAATGAAIVVGGYYLWTCGDECVVTPNEDQEENLVTLVNIYDGTVYGIQIGTSFQMNNR